MLRTDNTILEQPAWPACTTRESDVCSGKHECPNLDLQSPRTELGTMAHTSNLCVCDERQETAVSCGPARLVTNPGWWETLSQVKGRRSLKTGWHFRPFSCLLKCTTHIPIHVCVLIPTRIPIPTWVFIPHVYSHPHVNPYPHVHAHTPTQVPHIYAPVLIHEPIPTHTHAREMWLLASL